MCLSDRMGFGQGSGLLPGVRTELRVAEPEEGLSAVFKIVFNSRVSLC